MGLDMSHDAFSGAYSAFMKYRIKLAEVLGLGNIWDYQGFGGDKEFPDKPISILLNHSDCDGEIEWKDLPGIIKALENVLPAMAKLGDTPGHLRNYEHATQKMIKGFKRAFKAKENIEFY